MKNADYTYYTFFFIFQSFEASELVVFYLGQSYTPCLYKWYHTVRTQNGLSPCAANKQIIFNI